MQETKWAPTVVLVDADYLDTLALDLIENFGRMLNRRIPSADLCHWVDCVLLDGGLRPGKNEVQVHFLHSKEKDTLQYFQPSRFADDINGLSFDDNLGHISLFAFPVEEVVNATVAHDVGRCQRSRKTYGSGRYACLWSGCKGYL